MAKMTTQQVLQGIHDWTNSKIVYDVTANNPSAGSNSYGKFTLEYILQNADTLIPTAVRRGGMSIKFVQSSDNKYVQYRYMGTATTGSPNPFLDVANWQGVDDEPTVGSKNLVESGGTAELFKKEFTNINPKPYYLSYDGKFGSSDSVSHACIPVNEGEIYYLTDDNGECIYAFATSDTCQASGDIPLVSGSSVMFTGGANTYTKVVIPSGCDYLLFNVGGVYNTKCFTVSNVEDIVKSMTDTEPVIGSENLVKSGGVANVFRDIDKDFNPVAVLAGSIRSYYWFADEVNIPIGCVVRNVGSINVILYEERDDSASYIVCNAGSQLTADKNYTAIKGHDTNGNFKLLIYSDVTFVNDVSNTKAGLSSLTTTVNGISTDVTALNNDMFFSGNRTWTFSKSAYSDATMPITLPADTYCHIECVGISTNVQVMLNYGTDNYKLIVLFGGNGRIYLPVDVTTIRLSVTCQFKITIINGSYFLDKNTVGTDEIFNDSVTADKISGEHVVSSNLLNADTTKPNTYVASADGKEYSVQNWSASDYIQVTAGEYYSCSPASKQYAFYDRNKMYISGNTSFGTGVQIPNNAAYVRLSVVTADLSSCIFAKGQTVSTFVPYYNKVKNPNIVGSIEGEAIVNARLWNGYISESVSTLSNGESLTLENYPNAVVKNTYITLYANVTSWGNGITIGKGTSSKYTAAYAEIDNTNIVLKMYDGTEHTMGTVAHGLTITDYVKVIIELTGLKWKIMLQTLAGTFDAEITCPYGNGYPRVTSNGASLTDIDLHVTNSDFSKAIWMFGDSYFGMATTNRELYWLNQWGYLNVLVQSYGGQSSQGALIDLNKCIAISKPKYIVWALGMNDNTSLASWQEKVNQVKDICSTYGITLILATIPQCRNTTDYKYKDDYSDWIRENSDCRYIDVAKAVGSNAQGEWYGEGESYDYQSTDNVHPSEYGAKAIATQFLIDFPEIMQY